MRRNYGKSLTSRHSSSLSAVPTASAFMRTVLLSTISASRLTNWSQNRPSADGRPEIHLDDAVRLLAEWDTAASNCLPFEVEVRVRGSDGNYRWFLARFSLVRNEDGRKLRWYCACTDIEDRKRHEERLLQENAALRAEISQSSILDELVGSSESLRKVLAEVAKVARTD